MSYPSPPPSQSSTPTPAPGPEGWASPAARTLVPASALAAAAARAGVDAGALSVVEVPCASPQLYSAVLEYAALCPPVDGSPPRALWQNPEDEFEVAADEESESEGEGEESDDGEGGEREADVLPGRGLKKRRVPVPRLTLGLGQVEVVWPPPVGMTVGGVGRRRVVEEGDAGAGVAGRDGTVYVVHTALGEPVACNVSGVTVCRTVLLASAGGEERLRKFTRGVLTWRAEWDNRRARAGRFALYRFKTDPGCGRAFWSHEGLKRARPMASVVLREGMLEDILADVRSFLEGDTKAWYVRHGLPHRRSLLMEGPPGVGKTSCIRAIASEFELNCCFLSTTCKSFSNQMLGDALAQIPENALLVLEDVDSLFNEDRKNEDGSLTFSGMLNCLDGFLSADGVITIMTTNHADKLDAALTRGGRVDRRFAFDKPIQAQISALFLTFYPDADRALADEFSRVVFARPEGDSARSIATLQQLFIAQRRASAEECVAAIPAFFEMHFPNGAGSKHTLYT